MKGAAVANEDRLQTLVRTDWRLSLKLIRELNVNGKFADSNWGFGNEKNVLKEGVLNLEWW